MKRHEFHEFSRRKSCIGKWIFALAFLPAGFAPNARAVIAPTNTPATYIVRLDRGVGVDETIQWLHAKPTFVYRRAFRGFAVQMDTNTAAQLRTAVVAVPGISVLPSPAPCIVSLPPDADPNAVVQSLGLHPRFVYGAWKKPAWFKGNPFKGFAQALDAPTLARLDGDSRIGLVEPDGQVALCDQTNAAGIVRMGITNFPVAQINGRDERIDVDVAVLDSGIQIDTTNLATNAVFNTTIHPAHPDLNVVQAAAFADPGYYGDDWNGHGTRMSGIIGALDNDFGVVGVAPGVRLWSVQVIGPTKSAWANVLAGLDYIAQHTDQIEVVNASITSSDGSAPYSAAEQAVSAIVNQGTVFVAGAGNSATDVCGSDFVCGTSDDFLPAALPEVMCVSGMDPAKDIIWAGSNGSFATRATNFVTSAGNTIDVAAPAVGILSTTFNSAYSLDSGTSDSTAHVSGLVALYIAANGRATNAAGVYHIRQTLIDDGLPQSQWAAWPNTGDPDGNLEPLAIASEAWVPQPEFYGESVTTNGFALTFGAVPGYQYTVQYRDSLTATNDWHDFITTNGVGKLLTVAVGDSPSGDQRFYRLSRIPNP